MLHQLHTLFIPRRCLGQSQPSRLQMFRYFGQLAKGVLEAELGGVKV